MFSKIKSKIKIPYLINGCKNMWKKKYKMLFPFLFLIAMCCAGVTLVQNINCITIEWLVIILLWSVSIVIIAFFIIAELLIVSLIGTPLSAKNVQSCLASVGFTDRSGETPLLLSRYKEGKAEIFKFYSPTIPLSEYEKRSEIIENALNIQIVTTAVEKDLQHVVLKTVPAKVGLPEIINWDNSLLSEKSSTIILGESQLDKVTIDFNVVPHVLIGGSTGSGKSILLKTILVQCIQKGFDVYIADFKGGIDCNGFWRTKCEVFSNSKIDINEARKKLLRRLEFFEKELLARIGMLEESKCIDIDHYNKKFGCDLQRIIFACDEVSVLLDKTGLDKERKYVVECIERILSLIVHQGRAVGINTILSTQRPDSETIKGQIKSDMGIRICGRADDILSRIIIGTTDADEKVPKDKQGIFLTNTGVLFKAYYLDEDSVF